MNEIYQRAEGGQIALYQEGNKVMAAWFALRRGVQPVQQKGDCLGGLTSVLFQGSIYFAYENLQHQVAVDILGGGREKIVLTEGTDRCKFSNLILAVRGELLILLYQSLNPVKGRYEIHAVAPYLPEQSVMIRECGEAPNRLKLLEWEKEQYLLTGGDLAGGGTVYRWKADTEWEVMEESKWLREEETIRRQTEQDAETKRLKEEWEEEARKNQEKREEEIRRLQAEREAVYREQMEELRKEKEELMEKSREESDRQREAKEEALRVLKEQAEAEKEELMGALEAKDEEIRLLKSDQARAAAADQRILRIKKEYEAQLESARIQYNELAGTAAELQRIGKMWRDKCYQMEGRELENDSDRS